MSQSAFQKFAGKKKNSVIKEEFRQQKKKYKKEKRAYFDNLKEEEVIVYCRSGNRSGQAAMVLDMLGFKNTKNLTGGMLGWQQKYGN